MLTKNKMQLANANEEPIALDRRTRSWSTMNRRTFFSALGNGLAVAFTISMTAEGHSNLFKDDEGEINAWIHIAENGTVTIYTGKAEVGQNIRTSLAQIVAEELDVSMNKIEMIMGDTALTPYDRGTFGSRSIPYMGPQLRKAAASAREYLLELAAGQWKTAAKGLMLEDGVISDKSTGRSIEIGKLTQGKKLMKPIRDNINFKPVASWKVAGTSVKKVNGESFVTGKHKYVSDMKLPGMLFGKILRAPSYGAKLKTADTSAAKAMPGVQVVEDGDFIGVAAPTPSVAQEALKAIKATWDKTPQPSRAEIFDYLKSKQEKDKKQDNEEPASTDEIFAKSAIRIEQSFTVDYIAHAPLEPRAGVAQWNGDQLTVWTGTQRPFGVQEDLEGVFHIPKEKIRVIMPDTGSGYGGKHTGEAGVEAARLAHATGKPVKVVWSREEEFTWAYFRPAGVIDVKASSGKDGILSSWEFHNYNSGGSGIETPYEAGRKKIIYHPCESPLRQGSYRGLAATANTFARECVMDDLAIAIEMDPLKFRLQNLKNERMRGVLEAAASKFGWATVKPIKDHGIGLACGEEKGSYVATCAEVSVDPDGGRIQVLRVAVAFECGAIINPTHLENQIVGSVIQGIGGALFESVDFKDGTILNPSFSTYRVPRFSDTPIIDTVMLNRKDIPSVGAGETPILAIAPAIRNAFANATGKRIYTLPLQKSTES